MEKIHNKRILFVYYKLFKAGGVTRVLVSLANELVDFGYEVSIVIMTNNKRSFFDLDKRVNIIVIDTFSHWGFSKINVKLDKFGSKLPYKNNIKNYVYDFGQWSMLHQWMNDNHRNFDLIISSWYKISSQLALNRNVRYKTIAWEHANFHVGGKFWKDLLRKNYKFFKNVVAINTNSFNHYKDINNNTRLISNIIGEPFEFFKKDHIVDKENTLIYVGRLDEDKNVNEILDILENIEMKDFKFKIIGDGPSKNKLESIVLNDKKLKNVVEFLGFKKLDEIFTELSKSKIFLFSSKTECLPTVLIEALFCANAIISYDCKYGPSDIVNKENGFLIPMHDKKMFQEKLQFLIDNPTELKYLCNSSYEDSKKWRKENIINQWLKILN